MLSILSTTETVTVISYSAGSAVISTGAITVILKPSASITIDAVYTTSNNTVCTLNIPTIAV
jgi:hypothetical protein